MWSIILRHVVILQIFLSFPKRHLELANVWEIMETKGLKILNNVKTSWNYMLSPFMCVIKILSIIVEGGTF